MLESIIFMKGHSALWPLINTNFISINRKKKLDHRVILVTLLLLATPALTLTLKVHGLGFLGLDLDLWTPCLVSIPSPGRHFVHVGLDTQSILCDTLWDIEPMKQDVMHRPTSDYTIELRRVGNSCSRLTVFVSFNNSNTINRLQPFKGHIRNLT